MNAPNTMETIPTPQTASQPHGAPAPGANGHGSAHPQHPGTEQAIPKDLRQPRPVTVLVVAVVFVALMAGLFVVGWFPHKNLAEQTRHDAADVAKRLPIVGVTQPKAAKSAKDIILPGDVRPNQETPIFPRANGYLKTLRHDIHDRVEAGELLAEIDTPDIDAQLAQNRAALEQSKANVIKAQADLVLAQSNLKRYNDAEKEGNGSVTQQQIDTNKNAYDDAVAVLAQSKANVDAAAAAVLQLEVLQGFEKITAPFTGTITQRNYDVGALLGPANTSGTPLELFRISQTDLLRVYVSVPQTYSTSLKIGQPGFLMVRNYPNREFEGVIARTSSQLETNTRTLLVEVDFPNKDGTLYPGMYGQVRLIINQEKPPLVIPSSALIFNASGMKVGLVQDGKIHFQPIVLGRDLGIEVEVVSGLSSTDEVVTNPGLQLSEGGPVTVLAPDTQASPEGKPAAGEVRTAEK